jgi:hypothetical protein
MAPSITNDYGMEPKCIMGTRTSKKKRFTSVQVIETVRTGQRKGEAFQGPAYSGNPVLLVVSCLSIGSVHAEKRRKIIKWAVVVLCKSH